MVCRCALVGFVLFALALAGCKSSSGSDASEFREDFDVVLTLRPSGDAVGLPELEPPLSAEETRALRDAFSWEDVDEIAETDAEGRPALYYALVYLQSQDSLPYVVEAPRDRGGAARNSGTRQPAGAWLP